MKLHCKRAHDLGRWALTASLVFVFCMIASSAWGQAAQGTITGTVSDPQGAVVPAAKIEAKNAQTNAVTDTVTSSAGVFSFSALNPGQYKLTVSAKGFKSSVRENVELQISDRKQVDFKLVVGSVSETVEVTTQAPLLETGSASLGTVIAQEQINNLPVMNDNIMTLMQMTVGFTDTGGNSADSQTAWSTKGALSNYNVNGSNGFSAQYTLEGSPNTNREMGQMGDVNASDISVVPPADAVGEFKTQSNTYDAENGRSSGGSISISLRSGSNRLHGTLYEYFRNTIFNANTVTNKNTNPVVPRSKSQWNQPGGSISGPVIKDKLFVMFTTETDVEHLPGGTTTMEVPTLLERQGNFSENQRTIYDPTSTDTTGSPQTNMDYGNRTTIIAGPENNYTIPQSYLSSASATLALKLLNYLPTPNLNVGRGLPNVNLAPNTIFNLYHTYVSRVDYTLNPTNTFFLTYSHDNYAQTGGLQFFESNPYASSSSKTYRYNDMVTGTWTSIIKPSFVSSTRINYSRHVDLSVPYGWGYDPSQLGFTGLPALDFPAITLSWSSGGGVNGGGPGGGGPPPGGGGPGGGGSAGQLGSSGVDNTYDSIYSVGETLTKVVKTHSLKFGGEFWTMLDNYYNPSSSSGSFTADGTFSQQNYSTSDPFSGDPTASLLLGYPTSGTVPVYPALAYNDHYYALFVQDDWRLMRKLTLNLGARWDYESPETERHDRQVVGFDTSTPYLVAGQQVMGGLIYAKPGDRMATTRDLSKFQPRFGMAYQISNKLVFRGGIGLQASPTALFPNSYGYSSTTTYQASLNNNLTPNPAVSLANPYPTGIIQPVGNSYGLLSYLGQSISYMNPSHKTIFNRSYSAGFEYQLPYNTVVSASYVGMREGNDDCRGPYDLDTLPWAQYVQLGLSGQLNQLVPNPYASSPYEAGTSLANGMISYEQSILPYPQFSDVGVSALNLTKHWYDGLQVQAQKRMSSGLMAMANFTWSKNQAQDQWLNGGHFPVTDLVKEIIPSDRKGVFNLAASYAVPFFSHSNGIGKEVLGGWNASTILAYQSGQPANLSQIGNEIGSPTTAHPTLAHWFNTCYLDTHGNKQDCSIDSTPAWQQLGPYDQRITPVFSSAIRTATTSIGSGVNASIFKDFQVKETQKVTFRAEVYNMFNSSSFAGMMALDTNPTDPTFGAISTSSQTNEPRIFQFSLKYAF